ncbi:hypothetical protein MVEN_00166000 [Mycena venus]|uniref:Transmembrane protein n=1 Tax=Mycena venus TaxID=2733690 RepID=A0A8H6YWL4_9AGAR|nr:hypothetical protein MVEN_00166000 [Mycena venus]
MALDVSIIRALGNPQNPASWLPLLPTMSSDEEIPAYLQKQIQVSAYVFAGSTAVFTWDILNNLRSDYSLLFKQSVSLATLAYFAARFGSLVYVLGFTIFASYPLEACNTAYIAFNSFYPVGVSAAAFLFFLRVRAIYIGDRLVTIIFGFLWLAVLASSITIPIGGTAASIGSPSECIVLRVEGYVGSSGIIITVHDTIVFFTISYRLVSNFANAERQTRGEQMKELFSGANLPAFSKALFTDGQMYYMITVISNIVSTLMVYIPTVSPIYHGLLVVPNVTLTCLMACRVYRNTKLGGTLRGSGDLTLPTLNPPGGGGNQTFPINVVQFSAQRSGMTSAAHLEGDGTDSSGGKGVGLSPTSKANDSGYSLAMYAR